MQEVRSSQTSNDSCAAYSSSTGSIPGEVWVCNSELLAGTAQFSEEVASASLARWSLLHRYWRRASLTFVSVRREEAFSATVGLKQSAGDECLKRSGRSIDEPPLVDDVRFTMLMFVVVVANMVTIALETDASGPNQSPATILLVVNVGFLLCYITEIGLRFMTSSLRDRYTVIDIAIVLATLFDISTGRLLGGIARPLPALRLLRVLSLSEVVGKMSEGARVAGSGNVGDPTGRMLTANELHVRSWRTDALRELAGLANSLANFAKTLIWLAFILFIPLLIAAIFFHVVIGESSAWNRQGDGQGATGRLTLASDEELSTPAPFSDFNRQQYFGSVFKSWWTIFQMITARQWTHNVVRPVMEVYPVLAPTLVILGFLMSFGLLACVTANVVQSLLEKGTRLRASEEALRQEKLHQVGSQLVNLMAAVDTNGSGGICADELHEALKIPVIRDHFRQLGLPAADGEELIKALDRRGDGSVSYQELVKGAVRLQRKPSERDYVRLFIQVQCLEGRVRQQEKRLDNLCATIRRLSQGLRAAFRGMDLVLRRQQKAENSETEKALILRGMSDSGFPAGPEPEVGTDGLSGEARRYVHFMRRFLDEADEDKRKDERRKKLWDDAMKQVPRAIICTPDHSAEVREVATVEARDAAYDPYSLVGLRPPYREAPRFRELRLTLAEVL